MCKFWPTPPLFWKISSSHPIHMTPLHQQLPPPPWASIPSHWVLPIPVHSCCYFFHFRNPLSTELPLPVAIPFLSLSCQQRCLKSCVCLGSPIPQLLVTLEAMSVSVDFAYRVPRQPLCPVTAIQPVAKSQPQSSQHSGHHLLILLFSLICWISSSLGSLNGEEPKSPA